MSEHTGSSSLFAIFTLAIYSLFLIPYSIYYACNGEEGGTVQPYLQGKKKQSALSKWFQKRCTRGNLIVSGLWLVWLLLLWYTCVSAKELKPFDPFEILGVERTANDREIKKAYFKLSLAYHPDKNPDPKANLYFTEYISKAYAALTDEVSRQNYEKFGHPDGQQAFNMGVALPEWVFPKDKKMAPIMLLILICGGVLAPLVGVSWYMLSSNKYVGTNGVMQETLSFYYHSKFSIKESQSLVRIPETLVCAMEFIIMPTPSEQEPALDELRKMTLRMSPDLKDKSAFWKRKASVLKAHMLLLAYLERASADIPANLQPDLKFVLQKTPILLEEMLKIAVVPRPPQGYGWLMPSVAVVEMMQCVSQALSPNNRKPSSGNKPGDTAAGLLQLPHFDLDVVKKLKRRKLNTLKELGELDDAERLEALRSAGLTTEQAEEVATFLAVLPNLAVRVTCEVEGEEEIMEQDMAKCRVRVVLTRPSHNTPGFDAGVRGKAVRAYTPSYPFPKEENWHFFLTDPNTNSVLAWTKASLQEAEALGFDRPELVEEWSNEGKASDPKEADGKKVSKALATANRFISRYPNGVQQRRGGSSNALVTSGDAAGENGTEDAAADVGQLVELTFHAGRAGKLELQLLVMSDCYAGVDKSSTVRLRVAPLTRAATEGRDARSLAKAQTWNSDDDRSEGEGKDGSQDGSDEEDEEDDDYDSEETGELESGPETDSDLGEEDAGSDNEAADAAKAAAKRKAAAAQAKKAPVSGTVLKAPLATGSGPGGVNKDLSGASAAVVAALAAAGVAGGSEVEDEDVDEGEEGDDEDEE